MRYVTHVKADGIQWLVRGTPHLIHHDCHHEQKVDSKRPEDKEFGAFEVPPRDRMFLCPNQLIVFEG